MILKNISIVDGLGIVFKQFLPQIIERLSADGLAVRISRCQRGDPGSTPGQRIHKRRTLGLCCFP